jgi:hypothetical protein
MNNQRLIDILRASEDVDSDALNSAIMDYGRWGNDILRSLLEKHAIEETKLLPLLSQVWGVPSIDLSDFRPKLSVIERLDVKVADENRAIPMNCEDGYIDVAFDKPTPMAVDAVRIDTKLNVRPHVASPKSIDRLLSQGYGRMKVTGYQTDPRVKSGNFLSSEIVDMDVGEASVSIPIDLSSFDDIIEKIDENSLEHQIETLKASLGRAQQRIELLEAHVVRDQDVLRRLFSFLVDKGYGTREEFVKLLS